MRLPWRKPERRATQPAPAQSEDALLAELLRQQTDGSPQAASMAGVAIEQAAGLWQRAMASATPTPMTGATTALTPWTLGRIGRQLALRGEIVFAITEGEAGIMLEECSTWDVRNNWRYRVDLPRPQRTIQRWLPRESVLHFMYATRPAQPWRGLGPMHFCPATRDLAARLDWSLDNEYRTPTGTVLFGAEQVVYDPTSDELAKLEKDLRSGRLVAIGNTKRLFDYENDDPGLEMSTGVPGTPPAGGRVPTQDIREGFGDSAWTPPNDNPVSARLGPSPPSVVTGLRQGVGGDVLAAFGISPMMYAMNAAAVRESWRQFLYATIAPVAKLVAQEAAEKLNAPGLRFDFAELQASDVAGRARAFQSLRNGGLDIETARKIAGV